MNAFIVLFRHFRQILITAFFVAILFLITCIALSGYSAKDELKNEILGETMDHKANGSYIGDYVWIDDNRDGIQNMGETGMSGITVTLYMSGTDNVFTTVTDATGIYTFSDLISGTYSLEFDHPSDYVFSPPNVGGDDALDSDPDPLTGWTAYFQVTDDTDDLTWDAGLAPWTKLAFPIALRSFQSALFNGGFEQEAQEWELLDSGLPTTIVDQSSDPSVPLEGFSALLGGVDYPCNASGVPLGHAAIEQSYVVPQSDQHVTLRFKYIVWSEDASTSDQYDRFEVFVTQQGAAATLLFSDGNRVNQGLGCNIWRRVPGVENPRNGQTAGWAEAVVDLDNYKGQRITFSFRNYSRYDGWYNTYTYLDDVRVVFDH